MSLKDDLREARKRRDDVGNAIDEKQRERDEIRETKRKKKKRDPKSDKRAEQLEREIEKLVAEEHTLTKRIDDLQERDKSLSTLIEKIKKQIKDRKHDHEVVIQAGAPHWGGGQDILENEVLPVANKFGLTVTSRKRSASDPLSISNPSSDHNMANTTAGAMDIGAFAPTGDTLARAIASKLGISGYSTGNYNGYYIQRGGRTFRIQILWAVAGHFNHVHVGARLV